MRAKADLGLRAEIRARLRTLGQWVSVETGTTAQGVPDIYVLPRDGAGGIWIECKQTGANAVKFRPAQVGWLYTHYRYGGRAYIFVRRKTRDVDELHIVSAQWARELDKYGLCGVPPALSVMGGGPSAWDWQRVGQMLLLGS